MADDTDTPKTDADKPAATGRRRAPRKAPATGTIAAPRKRAAPKTAAKSTVEKAETAVKSAATKAENSVKSAAKAVKPRGSKRATPRTPAKSGKRATARSSNDKAGSGWGVAAIAGGVAAVGAAAAAALLSLRGSTPKTPPAKGKGAHQADGTDSSKSFEAGIADEGSVPE